MRHVGVYVYFMRTVQARLRQQFITTHFNTKKEEKRYTWV
jgi:hypothetical protein